MEMVVSKQRVQKQGDFAELGIICGKKLMLELQRSQQEMMYER